jgi:hypothetical protein
MAVGKATKGAATKSAATKSGMAKPRAPARRKAAPVSLLSRGELASEIRRSLAEASWLSAAALKKLLPRAQQADGLEIARHLAAQGEIFRYSKGSKEHFFAHDPIAKLEVVVPALLASQALPERELKDSAEREAPGLSQLLPEWLKSAVARRVVFEHVSTDKAKGKKPKTYSTQPDLRSLLAKSLTAIAKELEATDAANIPRESVLEFLASELGVKQARAAAPKSPEVRALREPFLAALRRLAAKDGAGALLSVRQLRSESGIDKSAFDTTALALSREGAIVLHHHDHAASLPESERNLLIRDASGTHYVGIALRGNS